MAHGASPDGWRAMQSLGCADIIRQHLSAFQRTATLLACRWRDDRMATGLWHPCTSASMFSLGNANVRSCEGITRREWLRAGGLSALGLTLPELLRARAQAGPDRGSFGRAKACIVVFLFGAPAHQDIWDLKPAAPSDVRGEFRPIATTVPGIQLGEHVPRIAGLAHRLALVRSVSHPDNTHTVAMHYMLTGVRHARPNTNPRNQPDDFPCYGA